MHAFAEADSPAEYVQGATRGRQPRAIQRVGPVPFRFLTGWTYNRTGTLLLVGLLQGAGNAVAGGSGFGGGALARLYPDSSVALMAHLVAFFLLGLLVLVATRGRLGATSDQLSQARG